MDADSGAEANSHADAKGNTIALREGCSGELKMLSADFVKCVLLKIVYISGCSSFRKEPHDYAKPCHCIWSKPYMAKGTGDTEHHGIL